MTIVVMPHILSRNKLIRAKPCRSAKRLRSISSGPTPLPEVDTPKQCQVKNCGSGCVSSGSLPIPIKPVEEECHRAVGRYRHVGQIDVAITFLPRIPLVVRDNLSDVSSCSLSPLPYHYRREDRVRNSTEDSTTSKKEGSEEEQKVKPISSFVVPSVSGSMSPLTLPPSFSEPWSYCSYVDYPNAEENQEPCTKMQHHPSPTSVAMFSSHWLNSSSFGGDECDQDKLLTKPSYFILDDEAPRSNLYYALEQYDSSRKSWSRANFSWNDHREERWILDY